jgi:hypothetical protein
LVRYTIAICRYWMKDANFIDTVIAREARHNDIINT